MGLGLSAVVALLLLLPGIAFVLGANRLLSPNRPPTALDQHFSLGFITAVGVSLLAHIAGLLVTSVLADALGLPAPDPGLAFVLLAGQTTGVAGGAAIAAVTSHWILIGAYLLALTLCSFLGGRLWDARFGSREQVVWADLLDRRASDAIFVVLTAEVVHGGRAYLYSGFLSEFRVARDGALERVAFREYVVRRALDAVSHDDAALESWIEIPGEVFVLQMRDVRTVNVDYFYDVDEDPPQVRTDDASASSDAP